MARTLGLLVGLWCSVATAAEEPRECASKLQRTLRNELTRLYPKAHVPTLKELDAAAVATDLRADGDGCYAVARGDFDGDGFIDVSLVLATGEAPQLVVALGRGEAWEVRNLPMLCATLPTCYVHTQRAGLYKRAPSLDDTPLRDGERSSLQASRTVLVSGDLEGGAAVYTSVAGTWAFVQVR